MSVEKQKFLEFINSVPAAYAYSKFFDQAITDSDIFYFMMLKRKTPEPVLNIALDYVSRVSTGKFSKAYFEKIIADWNYHGIKTAEEAMQYVKNQRKAGASNAK